MFFSRERKIFFTTQKLILGEREFSISAENCRNKIFYFFKHIFFLHNQETICLEKKHSPPLKWFVPQQLRIGAFSNLASYFVLLSLYVYYVINLQFSLLIKFLFGNCVYLYMFLTRIWHRREFCIYFCYSSLVLTTNISVAKFSFVIRLHMVLTGITWITQSQTVPLHISHFSICSSNILT